RLERFELGEVVVQFHELPVLVPGDLVATNPVGGKFDPRRRQVSLSPSLLVFRASHGELSTGYRNHFELDFGPRYDGRVRDHETLRRFDMMASGRSLLDEAGRTFG